MKKQIVVSTKVPPSVYEEINKEIESSNYMSVSDFTRQAIREKLKEGGGK